MKKRTWLILIAVTLVVGLALVLARQKVAETKTIITLGELPPISYPGFQPWPTPRTFDQPGTAFIQKGDRIEHVADILEPKKVGVESLVSATRSEKWKGGLLAQVLGVTPAKLSIDSDQVVTVKVEFPEGERWRIDRQALDDAIKHVNWPPEEDGKPYVVVEAISVNAIKYEVSLSGGAGGSLDISGLGQGATGTVTAQEKDDGSYVLNQVFSQPHYILYMPSEVHLAQGRVAEIPEEHPLKWTKEVISSSTAK